jgi:hypothetical protein
MKLEDRLRAAIDTHVEDVAADEAAWARITGQLARSAHAPGHGGRRRLVAAVVAFALFGAAAGLLWRSFAGERRPVADHPDQTVIPTPSSPLTSRALRSVGQVPRHSLAVLGTSDGSLLVASFTGRQLLLVDPSDARVLAQRDLGGAGTIGAEETSGVLWVLQGGDTPRLIRLDPTTLAITGMRSFTSVADGLAAGGGHLWMGAEGSLTELDPITGATTRTVSLGGNVELLAGDPSSGRLYVTLDGPVRHNSSPLLEVDATNGAVLAHTRAGQADLAGVSHLAATPDGVWVAEATGMMGILSFYTAEGLHASKALPEGRDGLGLVYGTNAIAGSYVGGHLFVANPGGDATCRNPRTGKRLGRVSPVNPSTDPRFVGVAGRPMIVMGSTLYVVDVGIAC